MARSPLPIHLVHNRLIRKHPFCLQEQFLCHILTAFHIPDWDRRAKTSALALAAVLHCQKLAIVAAFALLFAPETPAIPDAPYLPVAPL